MAVWQEGSRRIQKLALVANDGMELVRQLFAKLSIEEVGEALVMARLIWLRRNKAIFEPSFSPPTSVIERAKQDMADFQEVFHSCNRPPEETPTLPIRWVPPPFECWKINVDALINKEGLKMGVGILISNGEGRIVAARTLQIPFVVDPLQAEALASWYGVSFGREMGGSKVILEGDSLMVMAALKKGEVCNQAHGLLLEDIQSTFANFLSLEVHHVKREANMPAHVLAKYAVSHSLDKIWVGECPPFILSSVLAEREFFSENGIQYLSTQKKKKSIKVLIK